MGSLDKFLKRRGMTGSQIRDIKRKLRNSSRYGYIALPRLPPPRKIRRVPARPDAASDASSAESHEEIDCPDGEVDLPPVARRRPARPVHPEAEDHWSSMEETQQIGIPPICNTSGCGRLLQHEGVPYKCGLCIFGRDYVDRVERRGEELERMRALELAEQA